MEAIYIYYCAQSTFTSICCSAKIILYKYVYDLAKVVVLFIIMTWSNIPRLANQEKVCCQLPPVVALSSIIQPFPVKVEKIVLYTSANSISQSILVIYIFIFTAHVAF